MSNTSVKIGLVKNAQNITESSLHSGSSYEHLSVLEPSTILPGLAGQSIAYNSPFTQGQLCISISRVRNQAHRGVLCNENDEPDSNHLHIITYNYQHHIVKICFCIRLLFK